MKKPYSAPEAKIVCLVPDADLSVGWDKNGWKTDGFFWKSDEFSGDNASKVAWYDFGMDEIKAD